MAGMRRHWLAAWMGMWVAISGVAVPPQGEALLKTDLLGVFAHPDDETGVAPLIAEYALRQGKRVDHVYCTRGEGGGNMVGRQAGRSLGVLREAELRECLAQLGVRRCWFLDREDFAYTESLRVTLETWGHEATLERLVRLYRALRPEVVVTMNPAPVPGQHGNHQAAGWLAVEAMEAAADPQMFPAQIEKEGLKPWRPRKLYFGGAGPFMATVVCTNALPSGLIPARVAGSALSNHRSQAFGDFGSAPWFVRPQRMQLVVSTVPFLAEETDLFRGLPVTGETPPRVDPGGAVTARSARRVRFLPRPAVSRYEEWVEENGIEASSTTFEADIPVVAGETVPVPLECVGGEGVGRTRWKFSVPEGWKVTPAELELGPLGKGEVTHRLLQVTVPERGGEGVVVGVGGEAGKTERVEARLHAVPRLTIARGTAPGLGVDPADPAWAALPTVAIPHTNTWQGTVTNAADISGSFRVVNDGQSLWLEVRVVDDVVVSNIDPDDIRGHWRSDSVEVCVDPEGGAEHTLGAFKLGVFPFDRSGRVRGARDADREPGPVEDPARGLGLVSARTADGYLVRMRIPWKLAGVDPGKTGRIGFNVLVYDGDKRDAAPGENINKSRLAWAPRSGVQGRPEDWGRVDLGQ